MDDLTAKNFEAVYENGAFRPLEGTVDLQDGARVKLTVRISKGQVDQDVLALAARVFVGLAEAEIDEIEKIATDRSDFFSSK